MPKLTTATSAPLAVLAWAIGAAVFFRGSLISGFAVVNGDPDDGKLIVYLHEHLFRWLKGQASFGSPAFYFPQTDVLGYSEAFLLNMLPYAGFRLLGADPFLSMQLLGISLSALCFFCTYDILARRLGLRITIALAAALIVTFPNNLFLKVSGAHIQFFAIYYLPLIALVALAALKTFPQLTVRSLALTVLAFALYALLFATSFYTAWLLAFCVLIGLVHAAIGFRADPRVLARNRGAFIAYAGAAAVGFAVGIIPFMVIYLPVLAVHSARSFGEYISYAPHLYDVINVSGSNVIWGDLVARILGAPRASAGERVLAVTPVMTTLFIVWAYRRRKPEDFAGSEVRAVFVSACTALAIWSWLLTVKIGTFSAFWIPFHVLPGGGAIRAGERIQLLCSGFVAVALAILIDAWSRGGREAGSTRRHFVAAAILCVCMLEQLNGSRPGLDRAAALEALAVVPAPPAACEVAFTANGGQRVLQPEAMWIALKAGLPTINGASGWRPPNWQLNDPRLDYFETARDWITSSRLTRQVCLYDQATRAWSLFSRTPGT